MQGDEWKTSKGLRISSSCTYCRHLYL